MSVKLFLETFLTPDSVQTLLSSIFLGVIHYVITDSRISEFSGYGSLVLGLCVGVFGVLKMFEMWRLQRALRRRAEKENEQLGI
jgi:uncharacterized membrane protein